MSYINIITMILTGGFMLAGCFSNGIARDEYDKALAMVDQGTMQLRQGALEEAQASFEMAQTLGAKAQGLDGLGCVAFLRDEFVKAEEYFKLAYAIDATYDHPLANLALLYEVTGRSTEAEKLYIQALSAEPLDPRIRSNFGALLVDSLVREQDGRNEMLRAQALGNHPIIEENLKRFKLEHE